MRYAARLRPFLLLLLAASASAWAQEGVRPGAERSVGPVIVCEIPTPAPGEVGGAAGHRHAAPVRAFSHAGPSATFEVTYDGFPPEAEAAFQAAVDLWAQHVESTVPIRIRATWAPLETNVLGSAGPFLVRDFSGAPRAGTWYPVALANALAGRDLDPGQPDIEATFSSAFERWYFGTDGMPGANQVDLTTIVLHEIGHGLGFIGSFSVEENGGTYGLPSEQDDPHPFVFDRFVEDAVGRALLDASVYPRGGPALASVLQEAVFLGGPLVTRVNDGSAPLYSPPTWSQGTSLSHLDENAYPRGTPDALMTPFITNGEAVRSPGAVPCAAFDDLGWPLGTACEALVPDDLPPPPPLPDVYALSFADGAPNPFRTATALELVVEEDQRVEVLLFDAAGRRVRGMSDFANAGDPLSIVIDGAGLPSGVYFVRIVGEAFAATQAITRIR